MLFRTECNILYTECNILYTEYNILYTECNILYTECNILYTECNILYTECNILYIECNILYTRSSGVDSQKRRLTEHELSEDKRGDRRGILNVGDSELTREGHVSATSHLVVRVLNHGRHAWVVQLTGCEYGNRTRLALQNIAVSNCKINLSVGH